VCNDVGITLLEGTVAPGFTETVLTVRAGPKKYVLAIRTVKVTVDEVGFEYDVGSGMPPPVRRASWVVWVVHVALGRAPAATASGEGRRVAAAATRAKASRADERKTGTWG
jgi:hypothetical protein